MTTDEKYFKGNKLIAYFMGENLAPDLPKTASAYPIIIGVDGYWLQTKYHCNWNWLMPVVCRIERMGFEIDINSSSVSIYNFDKIKSCITRTNYEKNNKMDAIYDSVIAFIVFNKFPSLSGEEKKENEKAD